MNERSLNRFLNPFEVTGVERVVYGVVHLGVHDVGPGSLDILKSLMIDMETFRIVGGKSVGVGRSKGWLHVGSGGRRFSEFLSRYMRESRTPLSMMLGQRYLRQANDIPERTHLSPLC